MKKIVLSLTAILLMNIPGQVMATSFGGSSTGIASPSNVITFDELGNLQGQSITTQFTGASFNGLIWDAATKGQAGGTGFSGGDLTNLVTSSSQSWVISFSNIVTDAAFAIMDQGSTYTFNALLNGNLVESFSRNIVYNPGNGFIGFTNTSFNSIEIVGNGSYFAIDNLQYNSASPVPEPGTMMLLGLGMAGLAIYGKRRTKA